MRCEAAQLTLSARMDGAATASEAASAEAHATTCPRCSAFVNGVWRIREGARFEVAQPVPDLVPEIMRQIRSEPRRTKVVAFRRRMDPPASRARTRRAVAVALVAGFVLGVVMSAGGLIPRKEVADRALAEDIPADLRHAAAILQAYRAQFAVTELHWARQVPHRTFVAEVDFQAPERLRVEVRDTTTYPREGNWPPNDLSLVTDGRTLRERGPNPCPASSLPACPAVGPVTTTDRNRPPFDANAALPTDVIVPMTVLAASDRVAVIGSDAIGGRDAVVIQAAYQDAQPLFGYLHFLGSWRPFFPQDRVLVWLDHSTWFPLQYRVYPAPGRERSFWAIQSNLPYERPDVPVFTATVRSLTTWSGRQHVGHTVGRPSPWPPASLFAVQGPAGRVHDEGFKHLSLARLAATGVAPPAPSTTLGLNLVRSGRFARTVSRPFDESVLAYAQGLSWLTVTRVSGWERPALFGVGQFAQRVQLEGAGVGYYEPATDADPRRVAIHTDRGEVLVATNLDRSSLLDVARTLGVRGAPKPRAWRVHRWGGGTLADVSVRAATAGQSFAVLVPSFLPDGYGPVAAQVSTSGGSRSVIIVYRRSAAELDGIGLKLVQGPSDALSPAPEPGTTTVQIGQFQGRWSPESGRLEWIDRGVYRSLAGSALDEATMIRIAESLQPPAEGSRR